MGGMASKRLKDWLMNSRLDLNRKSELHKGLLRGAFSRSPAACLILSLLFGSPVTFSNLSLSLRPLEESEL